MFVILFLNVLVIVMILFYYNLGFEIRDICILFKCLDFRGVCEVRVQMFKYWGFEFFQLLGIECRDLRYYNVDQFVIVCRQFSLKVYNIVTDL